MKKSFRIYVTRKIPDAGLELLKERGYSLIVHDSETPPTKEELARELKDCDGLICLLSDSIDRELIGSARRLKVIANYAVGFNNIDVDFATKRKIFVTNTPDILTPATADLTWALILAVSKRIVEADAFVRSGRFKGWQPELFLGYDVTGKTLGIVGAGRIGQAVARRAKGFEMNILYVSNSPKEQFEAETGAKRVELEELLKTSDFVSIHCPLTQKTFHLLDGTRLRLMKHGAILINTARGPVVDETALVDALKSGRLAGAGLDVYENEPQIHPELPTMKNVVLLPHIGSATTETRNEMARMAAKNVISVLEKGKAVNPVNSPC
ncbi:MAG: D-glycerate dehydrogenase [Calditrichaeota bacterium]|nr:D-glycerate dehydrogenase [Calditrichota bacterium]